MENNHNLNPHIATTYRNLRRGMATLALAFPFVLWIGAYIWDQVALQDSISAYYHTSARNIFVGVLCTVGAFLYLYKGYIEKENIALNITGICAVGVAFFPTDPVMGCEVKQNVTNMGRLHGAFAVVFFLAISYVCIFLSSQNLANNLTELQKTRFRRVYGFCGTAMIACVFLGVGSMFVPDSLQPILCKFRPIFIVETIAVLIFSVYWITKSNEIDYATSWLPQIFLTNKKRAR